MCAELIGNYKKYGIKSLYDNTIRAELADEELMAIPPQAVNSMKKQWKDFGWYTDSRGYKHFGIIEHGNKR